MGQNIVEKILSKHIINNSKVNVGDEVTIKIDQTLTQDATGTMAYLQLESIKPKKLATEISVSYVDHNTTQIGFENADDHKYLQSIAKKYGLYFSKAGNGICHQLHLERFGKPGKTLLGSDSHTPTGGGIGMFAVGAGGLDVAVAMAKGFFTFSYPKVLAVNLKGKLKPWVSAKDIILTLLQILTTKGNVGYVVEYKGTGVKTLGVPERATITNMGAELGVTTSIFPSDKITLEFLKAQNRAKDWTELIADKNATYQKEITLDLSKIEPMVALPHSPDNVVKVSECKNIKVDQVAIGSCTNSSYRDLMIAVKMLQNKKIDKNVSFVVAPGSKQVLKMIAQNGGFNTFLSAGARFAENACGFCIGNSMSPGDKAVSVRTSNRNFYGRSGTKSAGIYLTSVETAIASAISGKITDPRKLKMKYPKIPMPKKFDIDDSMIIPPISSKKGDIYRGPNIGFPPESKALSKDIKGVVTIKVADKITTDHIMPAGDKLKYRSNIPKYAQFVFYPIDENFSVRALENKKKNIDNIIVAGLSYGQGSSREHAALCPMYLGVKVVIAKSFERIHTANLINFGIIPLTFKSAKDYNSINMGDTITISKVTESLINGKDIILFNKTRKNKIVLKNSLTKKQAEIILAGGTLNKMKEK